jgi:hypothetical protein
MALSPDACARGRIFPLQVIAAWRRLTTSQILFYYVRTPYYYSVVMLPYLCSYSSPQQRA